MHVEFGPYNASPVKRGGGWISPKAAQTGIIYGASYNGGFINMYALKGTNQTVIGQLTNSLLSPQGIVVDGKQRVWVANTNAGNIVAFNRGATTPFRILQDANEFPISVAVDESLNVYAANAESTSGPPGNVVMYERGATTPTAVLTYPDFNIVLGLGVDGLGNLYVSYIGSFGPSVVEFPKGSQTGQQVNLSTWRSATSSSTITRDLLMEDGSGGVGVWPPPYSGGPMRTIDAFGNEPTFTRSERKIWVALANPTTPGSSDTRRTTASFSIPSRTGSTATRGRTVWRSTRGHRSRGSCERTTHVSKDESRPRASHVRGRSTHAGLGFVNAQSRTHRHPSRAFHRR